MEYEIIDLPKAWTIETGSPSIKVGIIDSGIDAEHLLLEHNINEALSISFVTDFTTGLEDHVGHGTAVAGVIGAYLAENTVLQGVCHRVELVSLRVVNSGGAPQIAKIVEAIQYADENGIDILNCSMSAISNYNGIMEPWEEAIAEYSGLYVGSAGNVGDTSLDFPRDYINSDITPWYPRISGLPNAIRVGASTPEDELWSNSAYGATTVNLFAPGDQILTCYPESFCLSGIYPSEEFEDAHVLDGIHRFSGTSLAAPYVAGVAALMMASNPYLTPAEIKTMLMNTVDVVYDENNTNVYGNKCISGGRLNAYKAVLAAHHVHDLYENITDTTHDFSCSICDEYDYDVAHEYFQYTINTAPTIGSQHRAHCDCGYYRVEYHVVRASPTDGTTFPAACIFCGLLATDGDIILLNIPGELVQMGVQSVPGSYTLSDGTTIQILTENGSYVLPNGVIVLSEADAALVDAGLLDPYALVESPTVPSNPGHVTE